ncbi:reticulocalbin-3-like [Physeter macrocephalus]|uniref:Reticulocalbin-3-like n=1 Tax=Physeter macrocephalus TaxID=9755 RepID=A0A455B4M6_PHYMC|nr:reticulocalbin-3-like [Physeter catodon]
MDRAGDGDGWVSLAELRAWIAHTQQRHVRDSVSAAWTTYDTDRDGRVGWEELRNATYGHYEPAKWIFCSFPELTVLFKPLQSAQTVPFVENVLPLLCVQQAESVYCTRA